MFLGQTAVALMLAVAVILLSSAPARPSAVLGAVLVALALAELPLGVTLALLAGRAAGRQAALSGSVLIAVVLSTPAWFLALALATGQRALPTLGLAAVLALAYGLGVLLAGRLARSAAAEVRPPPAEGGAG